MSLWQQILFYGLGTGVSIAVLISLFKTKRPIRSFLGSGTQGICALAAVNVAGAFTGVSLGLNFISGFFCVVLGIPGVISLLVIKTVMNI
ncbi:MAG: pro-sigmaK processing inhibitor BofA family protein [Oscillospiraceae bacterium]|nr:pro-sigmaK processing inhibitor BofA family protein [Oscillospiraceae bacterium]